MRSSSMAVHWEQRTYGELDAAEQLKTFGAKLVELETHAIRHFGSEQAAEGRRRMDINGGRPAGHACSRSRPSGLGPKEATAEIPRTEQPSVSLPGSCGAPSLLPNIRN